MARRGLARAGLADDGQHLARRQVEVGVLRRPGTRCRRPRSRCRGRDREDGPVRRSRRSSASVVVMMSWSSFSCGRIRERDESYATHALAVGARVSCTGSIRVAVPSSIWRGVLGSGRRPADRRRRAGCSGIVPWVLSRAGLGDVLATRAFRSTTAACTLVNVLRTIARRGRRSNASTPSGR